MRMRMHLTRTPSIDTRLSIVGSTLTGWHRPRPIWLRKLIYQGLQSAHIGSVVFFAVAASRHDVGLWSKR